jgi:hypothetical protein
VKGGVIEGLRAARQEQIEVEVALSKGALEIKGEVVL